MRKNKILGYISVAVMSAIGAVISQAMIEKEIDERLKDTDKADHKETD